LPRRLYPPELGDTIVQLEEFREPLMVKLSETSAQPAARAPRTATAEISRRTIIQSLDLRMVESTFERRLGMIAPKSPQRT
jgi:hypothetical protein